MFPLSFKRIRTRNVLIYYYRVSSRGVVNERNSKCYIRRIATADGDYTVYGAHNKSEVVGEFGRNALRGVGVVFISIERVSFVFRVDCNTVFYYHTHGLEHSLKRSKYNIIHG